MCGICGVIHYNGKPASGETIRNMMQVQKHRGPDDEDLFVEGSVGLGFVRLSVIDLSAAGNQPMHTEDGRYVIVFNGEVFNYIELRTELIKLGYAFKTNTDTEVVLSAFQEWGEEMLHKLNGMWALAIYDRVEQDIFFARDRFGIKPFYYYVSEESFIFASEIPPILRIIDQKPQADELAVFDFLVFNRTDQTEQTFFKDIKKLPHGQMFRLKLRLDHKQALCSFVKWYDLRSSVNMAKALVSPQEYHEILSSSIGLRLRSDVPVGVCLSGGLDSSSIVSILLKDYGKKDLNTFSAIYQPGQVGNESEYISLYENDLENMHYITPSAETLFNDLDAFIEAHGEPVPSTSPYAQFKVMELAKDKVVVTLNGQGADEKLAGYHYFFSFLFKDLLKNRKLAKLLTEMVFYLNCHHSIYAFKTLVFLLMPELLRTKLRMKEKGYLKASFYNVYHNKSAISGGLYDSGSLHESLLNHFEYKLEHLLKWEDRNSMWFSLEARVPFLDYRLVEKTLATDIDLIIRSGMTKHILREAMNGILPEMIRTRVDKIGFGTPQDEWFRTPAFQVYIKELIDSESFQSRSFWDIDKIKKKYENHLSKKACYGQEIWKWIHLEKWYRKYID